VDVPSIVLLHGFTQTSASWQPVADRLGERHDVRAPDLPGHGTATDERAGLWETAAVLAETHGPATYVGYSMGGRVALHVAVAHPEVVERLVLVSATAGIDDDEGRAARRKADEELADRIEAIGVDAFLDEWLAQPLFSGLSGDASGLAERRANTAAGLAASLRASGTGMMDPPLWDRLAAIEVPVLVVAGELDAKFRRLGAELVRSIGGNAELVVVAAAGHPVPFEQPDRFADALERWFAATDEATDEASG
jgi:2-succinyl-6-hydroxy-2,4-cyclohexadiene-1-carboxylate synthase